MHIFNTPPLKDKKWVRLRRTYSDKEIELYSRELQALSWSNNPSEWSQTWSKLLSEMTRDVNTLLKCSKVRGD